MSYNLVERARKLSKLPAFKHGAFPVTETGRVSCEMFADFVSNVRIVSNDREEEFESLRLKYDELRDEHQETLSKLGKAERMQWAVGVKDNLKQVADTIDISAKDKSRLVESVN